MKRIMNKKMLGYIALALVCVMAGSALTLTYTHTASAENNGPPDRYSLLCLMRDTDDRFPELSARFLRLTGRIGEEEETRIRSLCEDILEKDDCRRIGQLEADGADLLNMGFRGAAIGETLKRLLDCVMRGELPNERKKLLEELKRIR